MTSFWILAVPSDVAVALLQQQLRRVAEPVTPSASSGTRHAHALRRARSQLACVDHRGAQRPGVSAASDWCVAMKRVPV